MLHLRIASAVILAPLFLALVYLEYPYFHVLVGVIAIAVTWEFSRMDQTMTSRQRWIIYSFVGSGALSIMVGVGQIALYSAAIATLLVLLRRPLQRAPAQYTVVYALLPAVGLAYVMDVGGSRSIFWLLAVVWATDIGAYAFGRTIGGPKLAPSVSPNKTWSGAVGGLLSAVLISTGLLMWGYGQTVSVMLPILAAALSVVSQAGDLFESAVKRRYQVKDSGGLIPGHGGVMDRFDGLWAAAPLAAAFSLILGGGVQQW